MMGGVYTFKNSKLLSDARISLFCFNVGLFKKISNSILEFCHVMSSYALNFSFEQIYYAFAEEPDKLFQARLKEEAFAIAGKQMEHLKIRESLCVHPLKTLNFSQPVRDKKL